MTADDLGATRPISVGRGTLDRHYPQMVVDVAAVDHNIAVVSAWCHRNRVELAPHIKTTMSVAIVERQRAAGARTVTVATIGQAAIALGWGCRSVLVANEIVDPFELDAVRRWREQDPDLELLCFVDSEAAVGLAGRTFAGTGLALDVIVEVGTPGGRAGARTLSEAVSVATAARTTSGVRLIGVGGYEGVSPNVRTLDVLEAVDAQCRLATDVFGACLELCETSTPVFTMGGSAFPDRVVDNLPPRSATPMARFLVRPGCYVTHDHGIYAHVSPFADLRPAVTVEALVISIPEAGLAVIGAGKRDLPYDAGAPVPLSAQNGDEAPRDLRNSSVRAIFDHHTVLNTSRHVDVSDVLRLGISHPCSAFDRWPTFLAELPDGRAELWTTNFTRHVEYDI